MGDVEPLLERPHIVPSPRQQGAHHAGHQVLQNCQDCVTKGGEAAEESVQEGNIANTLLELLLLFLS